VTGNLPWWAQTTAPDISAVFMELIDNRFDETVGFLYKNRASSIFWQKVVYQFNTEAKKKLADSLQKYKTRTWIVIGHFATTGVNKGQQFFGRTTPYW
jgi:CDP-glycerol glycerophosphotransferase (TagB/SpsB family)